MIVSEDDKETGNLPLDDLEAIIAQCIFSIYQKNKTFPFIFVGMRGAFPRLHWKIDIKPL